MCLPETWKNYNFWQHSTLPKHKKAFQSKANHLLANRCMDKWVSLNRSAVVTWDPPEQSDMTENITFQQLRLWAVINNNTFKIVFVELRGAPGVEPA